MRAALLLLALTAIPLAAQVRDSAGVAIVTNSFPLSSAASPWRLSDQPVFDIGGGEPDGPYDLRGFQVIQTASGRLIVTNAATFDIRVYDSLGKHIATAGRRGEGPNEFRSFRLVPAGDSAAVVFDVSLRRITWVDGNGRIGPTLSYPTQTSRNGQSRHLLAVLPDRTTIAVERMFWSFTGNTQVRDTVRFVRGMLGGTAHSIIAKAAATEVLSSPTRPGIMSHAMFGRGERHAVGAGHLYIARNDRWEVEQHRLDGTLVRVIRLNLPIVPITPARVRQLQSAALAEAKSTRPELLASYKAEVEARPYAATFPPIEKVFVARDGTLFVVPGGDPANPPVVDVFDPAGRYRARLKLPDGFRLITVSPTMLIGELADEDDVQHLVGFRIERENGR